MCHVEHQLVAGPPRDEAPLGTLFAAVILPLPPLQRPRVSKIAMLGIKASKYERTATQLFMLLEHVLHNLYDSNDIK